jgi:hypothetical protein
MYLAVPQTRGALRLYITVVDPLVTWMEDKYDAYIGPDKEGDDDVFEENNSEPTQETTARMDV